MNTTICRPAGEKDRLQILEIATHTWDGWDYVPFLLDKWLEEKGLFVAERDGRVVAVSKTTTLSPGELWLEGIRTKKELRGLGIGRTLARYQLEEALQQHPDVIRLSTAEVNSESIRIIERMGFSPVHTFTYLELHDPARITRNSNVREVTDAAQLEKPLAASTFLNESRNLIPWSWIFRELTPQWLSSTIASKRWFCYRKNHAIEGILLLLPHRYEEKQIEIALIDASTNEILRLLFQFAAHYAAEREKREIGLFAPSGRLEAEAKTAGFFFPYDFSKVLVYELIPS